MVLALEVVMVEQVQPLLSQEHQLFTLAEVVVDVLILVVLLVQVVQVVAEQVLLETLQEITALQG
jgi:hypothetical protein